MLSTRTWTAREMVVLAAAVVFMSILHGAVPFLMLPHAGAAIWTTGFSQSFANGPLWTLYAHDFGIPEPAPIAFGLAGAWSASLLIRLGLHPADAYSAMVALWLGVAFFSAYRIGRRFGGRRYVAIAGALLWTSMPIIWRHAGYMMVSLGIALLPFYFLAAFNLFLVRGQRTEVAISAIAFYLLAAIVGVFMDGYTFVMFANGASILFVFVAMAHPDIRSPLMRIALPTHLLSFALAFILYAAYLGNTSFDPAPVDFFRGLGLDLSFIAIPTKGVLWLPDLLGISQKRSDQIYFGDSSVWVTTFSLPVILVALVAWWRFKKHLEIATGVLVLGAFAYYMALGPSLKINSTKPESLQNSSPGQLSAAMPAGFAIAPTGNAWIHRKVPGFKNMRATYRWAALGMFSLWLLIIAWLASSEQHVGLLGASTVAVLIALNLPNIPKKWQENIDGREMFKQIDSSLVTEVRQRIARGERVAFVPWGNDFMVNYIAPTAGFRTFNIGGDKTLMMAQKKWPPELLALGGEVDPERGPTVLRLLIDGSVDVVAVPYFHPLWSASAWPCLEETKAALSEEVKQEMGNIRGFVCPHQRKAELLPLISALSKSAYVEVRDSNLFATIRLRPQFAGEKNRSARLSAMMAEIDYPIVVESRSRAGPWILNEGWHSIEAHGVWSDAAATLRLPFPEQCAGRRCAAILRFSVFGSSPQRPVAVTFESKNPDIGWSKSIVSTSGEINEVSVPLAGLSEGQQITISIPDATSPQKLAGGPDGRILGVALQRIDLAVH
jgi:hypothetical protein